MALIFKHGGLSTNAQSWARAAIDKYPYVVLVQQYLTYEWMQQNLIEHKYFVEDEYNPDGVCEKKSWLYSSFECSAGILYFFYDKRDYEAVCALGDLVIDKSPFATSL